MPWWLSSISQQNTNLLTSFWWFTSWVSILYGWKLTRFSFLIVLQSLRSRTDACISRLPRIAFLVLSSLRSLQVDLGQQVDFLSETDPNYLLHGTKIVLRWGQRQTLKWCQKHLWTTITELNWIKYSTQKTRCCVDLRSFLTTVRNSNRISKACFFFNVFLFKMVNFFSYY